MNSIKTLIKKINERNISPEEYKNIVKVLKLEVNANINAIRSIEDENSDEILNHLAELEQYQLFFSKAHFVLKYNVDTETFNFIRDFDRIDDNEWQRELVKRIKEGQYNL